MALDHSSLIQFLQQNSPDTDVQIHSFVTIDSTNKALWRLVEQGSGEGTVAIALQQSAGRGQWGRQWQSPLGGLYLSLALAPNIAAENGNQLTLCTAWGVAIALQQYAIPLALKWPNDLVLDGCKLGGILTETRLQQGRIAQAIVGIGLNWQNPVPPMGVTIQAIQQRQGNPAIASLEQLAAIVLSGLMAGYRRWQQQGIAALLPDYQQLLTSLGQQVTVGDRVGQVIGVSPTGNLQVCLMASQDAATEVISLRPGQVSLGYSMGIVQESDGLSTLQTAS